MTDFYMRPLDMKNGAVDLTHGAGGRATAQLINDVFGRHFTNAWLDEGHDGALLPPMNRPELLLLPQPQPQLPQLPHSRNRMMMAMMIHQQQEEP